MTAKIAYDIVSPEKLLVSDSADMVTIPGTEGYMGVMAGHESVVTTLRAGMIDISNNGGDTRYFIRGGFAEVNAAKVTVLAEEAIPFSDLDIAVIDQRIKDAEEDMIAAQTDAERQKVDAEIQDLRLVRALF
jgi:F-type H+-transporting ATPase subunit epsilon